jgi:hypothetical protein
MSIVNEERKIIHQDEIEAKQIYNEYMQMKAILEYIRKPKTQEVLEKIMKGYLLDFPPKVGVRRRSRI